MGTRRKQAGRWLSDGDAVIIFRNTGQVINHARVLDRKVRIATADLGTLAIPTESISSIVFKNLPTYPTDVLRTLGGTELNGRVLNDPIRVKADDLGGTVEIRKARIISIIW
jgi:hypothetical protein